jgi:hypothetical protein
MRQITSKSIDAFYNGLPFELDNTAVTIGGQYVRLFLFDNLIAYRDNTGVYLSTAGYQTNTTKERLNGLLLALDVPTIYQSNFVWYRAGIELKDNVFTRVKATL